MTHTNDLRNQLESLSQDDVRHQRIFSIKVTVPVVGELECFQAYRVIRRKRVVCRARSGDEDFLVKLFFSRRKAKKHWRRSDRGCRLFIERSLLAPKIHFSDFVSRYGIYVMVFDYIPPSVNLSRMRKQRKISQQAFSFFSGFIKTLALQHQAGIVQGDAHINNFLISNDQIYSLDGDMVKAFSAEVPRTPSIRNLVAFYSNLPVACDRYATECGRVYYEQRGWPFDDVEQRSLLKQIQKRRNQLLDRFMSKIYRTRDPFEKVRRKRFWSVFDKRNLGLKPAAIADYFQRTDINDDLEINHPSAQLMEVLPESKIPLKLKISNERVWRANRRTNGLIRRYHNANMINWLEINTCRPAVLLKKYTGSYHCQVVLLEYVPDGIGADQFFLADDQPPMAQKKVARDIGEYFFKLKRSGILANDVYLEDFRITDQDLLLMTPEKLDASSASTDAYWKSRIEDFLGNAEALKISTELFIPAMKEFNLT